MKTNRYGRAEILTPDQISLLFNEGFTNPRDRGKSGRGRAAITLPKGDKWTRGSFTFEKAGKLGTQSGWKVSKV